MENTNIELRPAAIFAFIKCLPLIMLSALILFLSYRLCAGLIWFSLAVTVLAFYRYFYIRRLTYLITTEYIRISQGIFFKRIDQVELYRIKDYVVTQPAMMQLFRLMNVTLKSTDNENPVVSITGIPRSDLIDELRDRVQQARAHNQIYEIN